MTATWPTLPASVPDLSGLSVEQASFLEQAMSEAMIANQHKADNHLACARTAPLGSRWREDNRGMADYHIGLRVQAQRWLNAANLQTQRAERDRCIAIRVIQAFAQAAAAEPIQEAAE